MDRNDDRPTGEPRAHETHAEGDLPQQHTNGEDAGWPGSGTEADILRTELRSAVEELSGLNQQLQEAEERHLRARAELDTMRRRMLGEVELARDEGVASALTPALTVFDDLERALNAADLSADPGSIVPGVRAVREGLLRNLASLGVELVGLPGDPFDPNLHEALTVVPLTPGAKPGTIAQVFEAGFVRGERLVRVARVTVFAGDES